MKSKLCLSIALSAMIFISCKAQKSQSAKIVLTNNSDLELPQKAISIKRNTLNTKGIEKSFPIVLQNSDTIPAQLNDLDGDGKWDELFFVADFSAKEKKTVELKWSNTDPKYTVKTSARFGKREAENLPVQPATEEVLLANQVYKKLGFQKYQTDGPTWENDKVGFRHYLDGRNCKDVFGKRTPGITPENVGISSKGAVEDNYHQMHEWGRDIFPVGTSAGLGGYGLIVGDEINRLGILINDTINNVEKTTFKIVSEGPVNSVLSYKYQNWQASGNKYQVQETASIWPGMYGYKNTVSLNGLKGNETLVIAFSNINNQNPLQVIDAGDYVCFILHDKLTYERQWILGTAVIIPKDAYKGYIEAPKTGKLTNSYLIKVSTKNNQPISYYPIAGWELSANKNFKDSAYFSNYVTSLAKQLSAKITVTVNK
ncbi:DUF4861 domain-containing protein [Flavobacterium hydrophilum]|uniref:DUF4861 domain-containing protein n=1 Tax=Flavobacterium hydrophilum TaxID=2211445 RepID=A0A2V4C5K3_9FLAO|nr:DUF4861 domain-containing protein [Flavobacterium hydrophilum]PXY46611.1 DUF4861 domain-containing protein [Flavobacterium hydrophilum]